VAATARVGLSRRISYASRAVGAEPPRAPIARRTPTPTRQASREVANKSPRTSDNLRNVERNLFERLLKLLRKSTNNTSNWRH
jgi:hypothetical protein